MHVQKQLVLTDGELYASRESSRAPGRRWKADSEKKLKRYHIANVSVIRYARTAAGWEQC
jgi:hypothetical protein